MCEFNPTWPPTPSYHGNPLLFTGQLFAWVVLVFGSAVFDLVGGLAVGLSCLVFAALNAPTYFLYTIFVNAVPSFNQFGPWAPLVGALVFAGVVLILIFLFVFLYRIVPENLETTTEEIEGKEPPLTVSSSEAGEAFSEI